MNSILNEIYTHIINNSTKNLYIAYSGGVDSSALLHLCSKLKNISIHAIHINHNLSTNADLWSLHCKHQSLKLNINFINKKLSVPPRNINIEQWARNERYTYFTKILLSNKNSLIFTAHHLDDQVETFLLNTIRGAGIKGLASIAYKKPLGNGFLIRPFLNLNKKILLEYCEKNNINWINDESNQNLSLRRNFIRHRIVPQLTHINKNASIMFGRSAQICYETHQLINFFLDPMLKTICIKNNIKKMNIEKVCRLPKFYQKHIIKFWLDKLNCFTKYKNIQDIVTGINKNYINWSIHLKNNIIHIENKVLYLTSKKEQKYTIKPTIYSILKWIQKLNPSAAEINDQDIIIRKRQPKDRCKPIGRAHSQKLKIIFQEKFITAKDRKNAWIIYHNKKKEIIAIYPFFICVFH